MNTPTKTPRLDSPYWTKATAVSYCQGCRNLIHRDERTLADKQAKRYLELCESCGNRALEQWRERTVKRNTELLKIENCPKCHTPYPLSLTKEPTDDEALAVQAAVATGKPERVACTLSYAYRYDKLYRCGCRVHDGHISPAWSFCRAHQPVKGQTIYTGCCYVCETPLTASARAHNRELFKTLDAGFCAREENLQPAEIAA